VDKNILKTMLYVVLASYGGALFAAENLRDPTRPLQFSQQQKKKSRLVLQAIFKRGETKIAIVNGKSVKQGQKIAGAQLISIGEKDVRVKWGKSYETIKLRPSIR